ncbi:cell wall hydrolase [Dyella monticola]|nr:cell wall hydrolase [Dyella monticola]
MKLSMLLWLMSVLPQPLADQTCLATTVYLEARSQSTVGQLAVAEVAMRRRERGQWGDTVCDVVKAPHQFALTTTSPNQDIENLSAFQKAWDIAGKSIQNWGLPADERRFFVPHADHFATASISPTWSRNQHAITIGDHKFYSIN